MTIISKAAHDLTQPSTPAPVVKCRVCGQPMRVEWQTPIVSYKPGKWICTCTSAHCNPGTRWQTFTVATYADEDLNKYLK